MMDPIQVGSNIFTFILSLVSAYLLARWFGDVAGTNAAIKYEKEKAARARIIAIQSLLNEVRMARDLARKNFELVVADRVYNTRGAVRMPVSAFETALVSKESALLGESSRDTSDLTELLDAVREYLTEAYSINALIDVRLAAIVSHGTGGEQRTDATRELKAKSDNLSDTLDRLERCLKRELDEALSHSLSC
jgi:hypothetical protein